MAYEELCQALLSLYLSIWLIVRMVWYVCGLSHLWSVGMGAGCSFGCQSRCSFFVFMDSSFTAEWWHTILVSLMCSWDSYGYMGPTWLVHTLSYEWGSCIHTCLVMTLAWLLPPALTQEVITSVTRVISLSSTVVVTILEEAVLL
jgi:hypothetical protein